MRIWKRLCDEFLRLANNSFSGFAVTVGMDCPEGWRRGPCAGQLKGQAAGESYAGFGRADGEPVVGGKPRLSSETVLRGARRIPLGVRGFRMVADHRAALHRPGGGCPTRMGGLDCLQS